MKTRITELLGIDYPIIQGGMAWVAEHHLAAAVSEAGGLGIIGAASAPAEIVREEIRKAKELTDKPIGVNIMLMNPNAPEVAKVVLEEGVKVVTTGAGNPAKFMKDFKEAGVKVIPVVASVAMAKMMERCGAGRHRVGRTYWICNYYVSGSPGGGCSPDSGRRGRRHWRWQRICSGIHAGC